MGMRTAWRHPGKWLPGKWLPGSLTFACSASPVLLVGCADLGLGRPLAQAGNKMGHVPMELHAAACTARSKLSPCTGLRTKVLAQPSLGCPWVHLPSEAPSFLPDTSLRGCSYPAQREPQQPFPLLPSPSSLEDTGQPACGPHHWVVTGIVFQCPPPASHALPEPWVLALAWLPTFPRGPKESCGAELGPALCRSP